MQRSLFLLGFLLSLNLEAQAMKLYLLSNHDNAGDHNQVLGVKSALVQLSPKEIPSEDLNTKTINALQIKDKIEKDLPYQRVVIVGSGEGGIDGIKDLLSNPNLIICLTSHMFLERYQDPSLLKKVNFIALPAHVSDEVKTQLGPKLIETIGVAHNRQSEDSTAASARWARAW